MGPFSPTIFALATLVTSFSRDAFAQGEPVQNGPMLPVALMWAGSGLLAVALIYGILRTATRTRAEKRLTEQATKQLYAETDREEKAR